MIDELINVLIGQYTLVAPIVGPCAPSPTNLGAFTNLQTQIVSLRSEIENIKSKRIKLV